MRKPVAHIPAIHNCSAAKAASSDLAGGLKSEIDISIGAKVMLRTNLWTQKGLVNGAIGVVKRIVYEENHRPPNEQPIAIFVSFPSYTGPKFDDSDSVPITSVLRSWKSGTTNCNRKQFPIQLAYAITIHKSQGLTFDCAVIDIGKRETAVGLSYVGLSRVKTLHGTALNVGYDFSRFSSLKTCNMMVTRKAEEERMRSFFPQ